MESDLKELDPCIDQLDQAITNVGETLDPILRVSTDELQATLSPLQNAKLDVISLYAVNSLFWVYLKTKGVDPTAHGLPDELQRVKQYMKKVKEFEDKKLAPTVNQEASKRVMRNALWSAAHKPKASKTDSDASAVTSDKQTVKRSTVDTVNMKDKKRGKRTGEKKLKPSGTNKKKKKNIK